MATWCRGAGDGVTYEFHQVRDLSHMGILSLSLPCQMPAPHLPSPSCQKCMDQHITSTEESDPWWKAFSGVCRDM